MVVKRLPFDAERLKRPGSLALTSANAAFAVPAGERRPVFTVGQATAAAIDARHVRSADGDVAALTALIVRERPPEPVLHLCAAAPAGDLTGELSAAGVRAERVIVYDVEEATAPPAVAADVVLLHSPRAGRVLARLRPEPMPAACLSDAVAAPLRLAGWSDLRVAAQPDEIALLALLSPVSP